MSYSPPILYTAQSVAWCSYIAYYTQCYLLHLYCTLHTVLSAAPIYAHCTLHTMLSDAPVLPTAHNVICCTYIAHCTQCYLLHRYCTLHTVLSAAPILHTAQSVICCTYLHCTQCYLLHLYCTLHTYSVICCTY